MQGGPHQGQPQQCQRFAAHRQRGPPEGDVDVLGDAARADQDQPFNQLRELVGELHRHPAAQGMTHDGRPLDIEHAEQVAHPVGVCRNRVVGAWLVGSPVAQQVRGDHGEPLGELGLHGVPGSGVVADAVDQQNRRPRTGDPVGPLITMDGAELQRRCRHFPHRAKIALAFPLGHLANLVVGPGQAGSSSSNFFSACWARNRSNSAPSSSPLGRSSSRFSNDLFS